MKIDLSSFAQTIEDYKLVLRDSKQNPNYEVLVRLSQISLGIAKVYKYLAGQGGIQRSNRLASEKKWREISAIHKRQAAELLSKAVK